MTTFTFQVRLTAELRVKATSLADAREKLDYQIEGHAFVYSDDITVDNLRLNGMHAIVTESE